MRPFRYKRTAGFDKGHSVAHKNTPKVTRRSSRKRKIDKSSKVDHPTVNVQEERVDSTTVKPAEECSASSKVRIVGKCSDDTKDKTHKRSLDETPESRPHVCVTCGKSFTRRQFLVGHLDTHIDGPKYTCELCGKAFRSKSGFSQHLLNHKGQKPFLCDVPGCGKSFACASNLRKHLSAHSDNKPFACDVCNQRFKRNQTRKSHMALKHNGGPSGKLFQCEICGRAFSQKAHMKEHLNSHSNLKPHICSYSSCSKAFANRSNLLKHERLHTGEKPYSCDICGQKFSRKDYLDCHKVKHTGSKPNICEVCGKGFVQKGNLKIHIRTHTGERPFLCDICGHRFTHKSNRDKHLLQHKDGSKTLKRGRRRKMEIKEMFDDEQYDYQQLEQGITIKTKKQKVCTLAADDSDLVEVSVENDQNVKTTNTTIIIRLVNDNSGLKGDNCEETLMTKKDGPTEAGEPDRNNTEVKENEISKMKPVSPTEQSYCDNTTEKTGVTKIVEETESNVVDQIDPKDIQMEPRSFLEVFKSTINGNNTQP